ncbi:MAG: bifunctional pyr operon transcriptional regulator/uracil phosphoribosyltransferase PyrR [Mucilaginibacter polytrichastri]|nr:bifunctional pyr operon transcriptional regulator/uracil phosphoribosyltransferase PyrR [Mucilaginibacter polytrichastri]
MQTLTLLESSKFQVTVKRLCYQLIENHNDFSQAVIVGLQPRGIYMADRICSELSKILPKKTVPRGDLDITFFRDDFRRREAPIMPSSTRMDFVIENKHVILIDDVLWTGRTIRAGMDALQAFGRPAGVELLVLVDRRFSRQFPIEADYTGIRIDSIASEKVKVNWSETDGQDEVILIK